MNIDELDQQYKAEVLEYEKRIIGLLDEISTKDAEIEQLRAIFPRILKALGNGARCTEDVSLEFLEDIPNEVKLEISDYKKRLERGSPCGDHVDCSVCINNEDCVKETVKDSLMDDIAGSTGQE